MPNFAQNLSIQQIDSIHGVASSMLARNNDDSVLSLTNYTLKKSIELKYELGHARALALSGTYYLNKVQLDTSEILINRANEIYMLNEIFGDSIKSKYNNLLKVLGSWHAHNRNFEEAEYYFQLALGLYKKEENAEGVGRTLISLGRTEGIQGNYNVALKYFLQARNQSDFSNSSILIGNIALCYNKMGQVNKAIKYLKDGLEIDIRNNDRAQVNKLNTLGTIYSSRDVDSAIYYGTRAFETARKFENFNSAVIALNNLAHRYIAKEQFNRASQLIDEAVQLADSVGITHANEKFDLVKALIFFNRQNYDSALFHARRGLSSTLRFSNRSLSYSFTENLYKTFEKMGNMDSAFFYQTMHINFYDTLYKKSRTEFTQLYAKIDNLEKQKEIELLQKQKVIDQTKKANLIISVISILLVSVGMVIILIYRHRYKQKKLKIKEIELKSEIEKKETQLQQQTLHMINMTNNLSEVEGNLKKIKESENLSSRDVQKVLSSMMVNKSMNKEWQQFEEYFSNIHPSFSQKLVQENEKLTQQERRLTALIKLDLSNREIASLLHIEQRSVIMNRYRLKRKLGLGENDDLESYIQSL